MASQDYQQYLKQKHAKFNTSHEVINEVVKQATDSEVGTISKLLFGEVNEVYDVSTNAGQEVIVRISRSKTPRFLAEACAVKKAREAGVPAPEVLLVTSKTEDGNSLTLCVEKKLPGDPLSGIPYEQKDKLKYFVTLAGEVLAKLHSVSTEGFGGLNDAGNGKLTTWEDYMMEVVKNREKILTSAKNVGISETDIERGFAILEKNSEMFKSVKPHLLHGDFSTKHILISGDEITGLIDFENCKSGDPIVDFAWWSYFYSDELLGWLKTGYSKKTKLDPEFDKKLVLYRIRLGLSLITYYEEENHTTGIKHTKEKLAEDVLRLL